MSRRLALSGLCVALLAFLGMAGASAPPPSPSPGEPRPLDTVAAYLDAFAAAFELPHAESEGLAIAHAGLRASAWEALPHVSFRERLSHDGDALDLRLALDVDLRVYEAAAAARSTQAAAEFELSLALARQAEAYANAAFLHDVVALAILTPTAQVARDALAAPELQALAHFDALAVPTAERATYEAVISGRDGSAWLHGATSDIRLRLARRLGVPPGDIAAPSVAGAAAAVSAAISFAVQPAVPQTAPPTAPHAGDSRGAARADGSFLQRCLAEAPAVAVARARHSAASAASEVLSSPDLSVTLAASLEYEATLHSRHAAPSGTFGAAGAEIAARFVLPAAWPLAGSVGASAGSDGASQEFEVSWPPRPTAPLAEPDPDSALDDELAAATADAVAALRALDQAVAERERRERALTWALLDVARHLTPAEAHELATSPLDPAWPSFGTTDDMRLTELRVDAALALLGELAASIDLAAVCGALPGGGADRVLARAGEG